MSYWFMLIFFCFFFFNVTATTEIYTLSLHDALPISVMRRFVVPCNNPPESFGHAIIGVLPLSHGRRRRSEEHTSELQSRFDLVCRLLLEKKKNMLSNAHFACIMFTEFSGRFIYLPSP